MYINYVATHCYRKDYDDEQSLYIEDGFLFTTVEWSE